MVFDHETDPHEVDARPKDNPGFSMFCVFYHEGYDNRSDGGGEGEGLDDVLGGGGGFILDDEEVGVEVRLDRHVEYYWK